MSAKDQTFLFKTKKLFGVQKPIIAMLHLGALPGQPGYKNIEAVIAEAKSDVDKLQFGGVNGVLIENWWEDSDCPETKSETADAMLDVIQTLKPMITIPFGINVLNNDYRAAFRIASATGASFVELDVFTDQVRSDFSYSSQGIEHPFEIHVDTKDVARVRSEYGLMDIPLIVFIQPKHYKMLDEDKSIEASALEAIAAGADGLLITKATGVAPDVERIKRVKQHIPSSVPVGIGSGFSVENAQDFLPVADFVVVGSTTKVDGDVDNPVDLERVKKLMSVVKLFQS